MAEALDDLIDDPARAAGGSRAGAGVRRTSYDAERLGRVLDEVYRPGLAAPALDMAG